jgi:hypothetical protein
VIGLIKTRVRDRENSLRRLVRRLAVIGLVKTRLSDRESSLRRLEICASGSESCDSVRYSDLRSIVSCHGGFRPRVPGSLLFGPSIEVHV